MPQPNVYWFYNQGTNDVAKTAGPAEDSNFKAITPGGGHTLAFTGQAAMGGTVTGTRDNILVPDIGSVEFDKTFIDNATTIEQVPLAGTSQGKQSGGAIRYPFCIHFDGPTTSKVFLEAWDDSAHLAILEKVLGGGTPENSFIKGITTTYAGPVSADWVANNEHKNLAGNGANNRLELSNAALPGPTELYFNLAGRLPAGAGAFNANPVLAVRFTWS